MRTFPNDSDVDRDRVRALDYATPGTQAELRDLWRALLLTAVVVGSAVILECFIHIGAAWGQRREGTQALFEPATGTGWYDRVLIDFPMWAMASVCGAVSCWSVWAVVRRRWNLVWLLVVPISVIAWFAFVFINIVTIWDDISP